ncbi:MAG: cytochrome c-type biogenesis protein CcmH [Halioglobus sp.]|jgi:cytochrome c-type biogenesis protein CcmH
MNLLRLPVCLMALLFAASVSAVIETYEFSSPELEQRYQDLSGELRCPKCQNQNIADSNAPIAKDLRKLLYQQLEEGASDAEIRDYMVARYGEFVRYRPSFSGATIILWLAPALLLLAAALVVVAVLRGRAGRGGPELSAEEQRRLQELVTRAETEENAERHS